MAWNWLIMMCHYISPHTTAAITGEFAYGPGASTAPVKQRNKIKRICTRRISACITPIIQFQITRQVARTLCGQKARGQCRLRFKAWREVEPVSLVTTVIERCAGAWGAKIFQFRLAPLSWPSHIVPESRCCQVAAALRCVLPPARTQPNLIQHHIEMRPGVAVRSRPYQLPEHKRKVVREELAARLEMGVIEESNSAWCSPLVLVPKKDGTVWFCVNYRKVNDVSQFDAYPMPRVEEPGSVRHGLLLHDTGFDQRLRADSPVSRI